MAEKPATPPPTIKYFVVIVADGVVVAVVVVAVAEAAFPARPEDSALLLPSVLRLFHKYTAYRTENRAACKQLSTLLRTHWRSVATTNLPSGRKLTTQSSCTRAQ